jgi:cytosine/adenosine deaminase-related metal-dependent hydrolase
MSMSMDTLDRRDAVLDALHSAAADPERRILLTGGTVLSMDPAVGDFERGDVLVEGSKLIAVGADLSDAAADGQAIVVDLEGTIVIPGMHDTHRHCWENQFRRLLPDAGLGDYVEAILTLGPYYRPEDIYAGTLISALGAIDSGVTGVLDFCHNSRSAAHSDAAIKAWVDSGMRAIHASCAPPNGAWDEQWPADLRRMREHHFSSDDQLVTLRIGLLARALPQIQPPLAVTPENLGLARELGLEISLDGVFGDGAAQDIAGLHAAGLLGPDITYIHCTDIPDETWRQIADTGGTVSLAVTSDAQLGCLGAIPPVQKALDHGLRPSLSVDVECCLTTDMFTQMQVVLNIQRMLAYNRGFHGDDNAPGPIAARDVLSFATVEGAKANGLLSKCGTLTPGKEADLVAIRADDINVLPLNNAVGTVVLGADSRNVDTVFVAGKPRKWRGSLTEHDLAAVRRLVTDSRDYLVEASGYTVDVLS